MSTLAPAIPDTRREFDHLFGIYWPIGLGVYVVVAGLILFMALRYRSRKREWQPTPTHHPVEELYALGIAFVAGALLYFTYSTMSSYDRMPFNQDGEGQPGKQVRGAEQIKVTAARWHWRFDYPKYGITEAGATPTLTVPQNRPVRFEQTSLDVVHSLWIPERRFKVDAFPGRTTTFTLTFPNAGFRREGGECNQFCGLLHSYMDFNVEVLPQKRYAAWVKREQRAQGVAKPPRKPKQPKHGHGKKGAGT